MEMETGENKMVTIFKPDLMRSVILLVLFVVVAMGSWMIQDIRALKKTMDIAVDIAVLREKVAALENEVFVRGGKSGQKGGK